MPDFMTPGLKRKERKIPGEEFSLDFAYEECEERKRSAPSALDEVRAIHQAGMKKVDEDPDSGTQSPILLPPRPKRQRVGFPHDEMSDAMQKFLSPPSRVDAPVQDIVPSGVDAPEKDSSVELLIPDEDTREYIPPEKQEQSRVEVSNLLGESKSEFTFGPDFFNKMPPATNSEMISVPASQSSPEELTAPRFDLAAYARRRWIGEYDPDKTPVSDSPPSSTEVMKQVPERSGSTTRENTPDSEIRLEWMDSFQLFQERQRDRFGASLPSDDPGGVDNFNPSMQDRMNASEKAKPLLMFLAGQTLHADMIAALDEIAEEISACDNNNGSHVSESPQSGDDPECNIRGRIMSANSLMGAGPNHGCVE